MVRDNNERNEWLDSLTIGDEVAIDVGRYGNRDYEIRKIERITPTRRFSLQGKSAEFDSNGIERGKTDSWRGRQRLQPATKEISDDMRKKYVVARLEKINWRHMELAKLEKFLTFLDSDS